MKIKSDPSEIHANSSKFLMILNLNVSGNESQRNLKAVKKHKNCQLFPSPNFKEP